MRRAITVASIVVLVLTGCGVSAQDDDHVLNASDVPFDLLAPSTTTTTTSSPATTTTLPWRSNLWFVTASRLVPAPRQLREQPDVATLLRLLRSGPDTGDSAAFRTALPPDTTVRAGVPAGGVLTIELDAAFQGLPASEQVLALAQLVFTATEVPGVGRISFRIGDSELVVPIADGQLVQRSVSRDDYAALAY